MVFIGTLLGAAFAFPWLHRLEEHDAPPCNSPGAPTCCAPDYPIWR